jgi:hypothetical protein
MTFEERVTAIRELAREESAEEGEPRMPSPAWDDDMFKNGWPNCWGDFNNIMR